MATTHCTYSMYMQAEYCQFMEVRMYVRTYVCTYVCTYVYCSYAAYACIAIECSSAGHCCNNCGSVVILLLCRKSWHYLLMASYFYSLLANGVVTNSNQTHLICKLELYTVVQGTLLSLSVGFSLCVVKCFSWMLCDCACYCMFWLPWRATYVCTTNHLLSHLGLLWPCWFGLVCRSY